MDKKYIFEFKKYKHYLQYLENERRKTTRGFRVDLAKACRCQTAYISQILNGNADLSLEQAQALNEFFGHNEDESKYFIFLVQAERSGTQELRKSFLQMMDELREKHLNLKLRFQVKEFLGDNEKVIYYSEWLYAAVHMAVTVPLLQTPESIAKYLRVPVDKVRKVLTFLSDHGLVQKNKDGRFTAGNTRIHLGDESPLSSKSHINWRMRALASLESLSKKDLHFTSIVSVSKEDVEVIRERFIKEIEAYNALVKPSKEEVLYCLALDFFHLSSAEV